MKQLIFSLLLFGSFAALAQPKKPTYNAGIVTVADSIFLNGTWVKAVRKDTSLVGAKDNELASAKAMKAYIDNKVINAGSGGADNNNYGSSVVRQGMDVTLANDLMTPGNLKVYGTNNSGAKGWYDAPSGGTTWTLRAMGISPGGGNKGAALQSALTVGTGLTYWAEEPGIISLGQSVNGLGKTLKMDNGSRYANGALTGISLNAPHDAYVVDTSVASTNFLNTDIYTANFGFLPSASAAQNTRALQRIAALINSMGGGVTLHFQQGVYTVGMETFTAGQGYTKFPLFDITGCTKPVTIELHGATIKFANGLHYGSFNSTTGLRYNAAPGGYYGPYAAPGILFNCTNNKSITIRGGTLDGNLQNYIKGGYWDDIGIQLPSDGIFAENNDNLLVENVVSKNFGRDGIQVNNVVAPSSPVKYVTLSNSVFDGNGRQGLSWVGGNHLYAVNCSFINTGKTYYYNNPDSLSYSAPGAGVDMEAESPIRGGVFENCTFGNSVGAALLSVGNNVSDVKISGGKILGLTNWSVYQTGAHYSFDNVTIVGSLVNLRIGTGPNDVENSLFSKCTFSMDTALSPTGKVFGIYAMDLGGGGGGHFTNCDFDFARRGTIYGGYGCRFTDCNFRQKTTATGYLGNSYMNGNFYGTNTFFSDEFILPDNPSRAAGSTFHGPFYFRSTVPQWNTPKDIASLDPERLKNSIIDVRTLGPNKWEFLSNIGDIDTVGVTGVVNVGDTVGRWVGRIFKKPGSDSVFYKVGNNATFAYLDSVGSGGGNPASLDSNTVKQRIRDSIAAKIKGIWFNALRFKNSGDSLNPVDLVTIPADSARTKDSLYAHLTRINQITASLLSKASQQALSDSAAILRALIGTSGGGSSPWAVSGSDISYVSGNVGIGTSSPGSILDVFKFSEPFVNISYQAGNSYGGLAIHHNAGYGGSLLLVSNAGAYSTSGMYRAYGSYIAGAGAGGLSIAAPSEALRFYAGDDVTQRLTVSSTAVTAAVPLSVNGVVESTSGGMKFPDGTTQTTAASNLTLASGTYTPTITLDQNISSYTAYQCQYLRVGNTVTVSGRVDVNPSTAGQQCYFRLSLPIASNLTGNNQAAGTATASSQNLSAAIYGVAATDDVAYDFIPATTGTKQLYFSFTYRIN